MEDQNSTVRIHLSDRHTHVLDDVIVTSKLCAPGRVSWTKELCVLHVDSKCQKAGISREHWLTDVDSIRHKSLTPQRVQIALQQGSNFTFTKKAAAHRRAAAARSSRSARQQTSGPQAE